ncbi:MAG: hypothetical protein VX624_13930, partial [Pseudomonadota bacterium]|nr:hypothetical protein [Pseudomonadota bacterium]
MAENTEIFYTYVEDEDPNDPLFGVDTCANLLGVNDKANILNHLGERSLTKTSAGVISCNKAMVSAPVLGKSKATYLPHGNNIMGASLLIREGYGFTWLPDKIAGQLGLPAGPAIMRDDGTFVRCALENEKPMVNNKLMENTINLREFRKEQEFVSDEILETFAAIRQGDQEAIVLHGDTCEVFWMREPGKLPERLVANVYKYIRSACNENRKIQAIYTPSETFPWPPTSTMKVLDVTFDTRFNSIVHCVETEGTTSTWCDATDANRAKLRLFFEWPAVE